MAEYKTLSLRDAAQFDYDNKLADKLTGWGAICKQRANDNSKSQRRKRGRKSK